jgi:hypothetical protein
MFTADVDTTRLNRAMALMARESRKGLDDVIEKETATIVGHLIAMTPPGKAKGRTMTDRGGIDKGAKKLGEAAIRADISLLFPTTKDVGLTNGQIKGMIENGFKWGTGRGAKQINKFASSVAELERIHKSARSYRTGRVKIGSVGQNMAITRAGIRNQFIKQQIKKVGILNAGWLRAARRLKTAKRSTPAWITRHGEKPGNVVFRKTKHGLAISVSNNLNYFPKNIESRMQQAINRRSRGIEKALVAMLERKAARAEQRMLKK